MVTVKINGLYDHEVSGEKEEAAAAALKRKVEGEMRYCKSVPHFFTTLYILQRDIAKWYGVEIKAVPRVFTEDSDIR